MIEFINTVSVIATFFISLFSMVTLLDYATGKPYDTLFLQWLEKKVK